MSAQSPQIVVAGAGVGGLRAALDLAETGYEVLLLDREQATGGLLQQLDRQFPTDLCGMCRMLPMLDRDAGAQACMRRGFFHKNIQFLPGAEIAGVSGSPGRLHVTVKQAGAGPAGLDDGEKEHNFADVAGVLLAYGPPLYDPATTDVYGGGVLPDVVAALEYERLCSGLGLPQGKLLRPSNCKPVQSAAWIQCVGSRNLAIGAGHCSSACCMFALKEARMARERGVEATIFYMDMRTQGRDYQRYRDEAEAMGVRLVRCRPHSTELDDAGRVRISYMDAEGRQVDASFDLVVLSTGKRPDAALPEFARQEGVVVVDPDLGLKDIATTLTLASAAAAQLAAMARRAGAAPAAEHSGLSPELQDRLFALEPERPALATADDQEAAGPDVNQRGLVLGGGPAGVAAALALAGQGADVTLVERSKALGGNLNRIRGEAGEAVRALLAEAQASQKIELRLNTELARHKGRAGRFIAGLRPADDPAAPVEQLEHGAIILATGGGAAAIERYSFGADEKIIDQIAFQERLQAPDFDAAALQSVVMVQCAGTREEPRNYCSKMCCAKALDLALELLDKNPQARVTVLYRDMMTWGGQEKLYTEARRRGVRFAAFDVTDKPIVEAGPSVRYKDPVLREDVEAAPDLVVLAGGVAPNESSGLAAMLRLSLTEDGFIQEADPKWRPVDTGREGVFAAGLVKGPVNAWEAMAEGRAAAQRAMRLLSRERVPIARVTARVRASLCSRCEMCLSACPYEARYMDPDDGYAAVDPVACQGCGACVAACPNAASVLGGYEGQGLLASLDKALDGVFD